MSDERSLQPKTAPRGEPKGEEFNAPPPPGWERLDMATAAPPAVRVGLIALANDCAIESDFRAFMAAPDVAVHTTRVYSPLHSNLASLVAVKADIAEAVEDLMPDERLDAIAFGCTSATMANGAEAVRDAVHAKRPGIAVTDPISAALAGLERLGCRRIALLTPYIGEVNLMVERYISDQGLEIASKGFFGAVDDNERSRITPEAFEQAAAQLVEGSDAEGLFLSCTALTTSPVVERLEGRLGLPVVSSNQALAWASLRVAGYASALEGRGRLLQLV